MMNNNDDYLNLVKKHIELDKLLYDLSPKEQQIVEKLIKKRNHIHISNNLFAEYRINQINKKISKIKQRKA